MKTRDIISNFFVENVVVAVFFSRSLTKGQWSRPASVLMDSEFVQS